MTYRVQVVEVAPTVIASVRRRIAWREIAANVRPLLDVVWAFLRTGAVDVAGHNVLVYHAISDTEVEVEAGVQVAGEFASTQDVRCSATPGGRVATTTHVGPYADLKNAYAALIAWCDVQGERRSAHSWELYGDWSDDPRELRTDLYWLLA